jgi:uncharacterized protein YcbK (DUF882 family)
MPPLGPSPHLTWAELACHDDARTPYPLVWRETRAVDLASAFEEVRALLNQPLLVVSAYRTPAWNRHVGGARKSQHVEGRALDLVPTRGLSLADLYDAIHAVARSTSRIRGIGRYPTFIHFDVRPSSRLIVWTAPGG